MQRYCIDTFILQYITTGHARSARATASRDPLPPRRLRVSARRRALRDHHPHHAPNTRIASRTLYLHFHPSGCFSRVASGRIAARRPVALADGRRWPCHDRADLDERIEDMAALPRPSGRADRSWTCLQQRFERLIASRRRRSCRTILRSGFGADHTTVSFPALRPSVTEPPPARPSEPR